MKYIVHIAYVALAVATLSSLLHFTLDRHGYKAVKPN